MLLFTRHHLTTNTNKFHLPFSSVYCFLYGYCFGKVQNQFRIQYISPFLKIKNWNFCKNFTQTIHLVAFFWWIEVGQSMIEIFVSIKKMNQNLPKNFNCVWNIFHNLEKTILKYFFHISYSTIYIHHIFLTFGLKKTTSTLRQTRLRQYVNKWSQL